MISILSLLLILVVCYFGGMLSENKKVKSWLAFIDGGFQRRARD